MKPLFLFAREALPRLDNYRRSIRALKRPSLGLLHGEALEHIQVSSSLHTTKLLSITKYITYIYIHIYYTSKLLHTYI